MQMGSTNYAKYRGIIIIVFLLISIFILVSIFYNSTQQADIDYYQGHRYFRVGNFEKAIVYHKKALAINPSHSKALNELSYSCQWTNRHDEAISIFRKILAVDPYDYKIKRALAQTLSWQKKYDESTSLFKEIISATNDNDSKMDLAEVYAWEGHGEKSEEILRDVLKAMPDDFRANMLLGKALLYSGRAALSSGIFQKLFKRRIKPEEAQYRDEIQRLLADSYMISKDYPRAIAEYEKIIRENPKNVKTIVALAEVLSWNKKYAESISGFEQALKIEPDNLQVKAKLAEACSWDRQYEKSIRLYKEILAKNPDDAKTLANLAEVLTWSRDYIQASRFLEAALAVKEDANLRLIYATAVLYSGDYRRAAELLTKIIKNDPENTKAKVLMADGYAYSKEFELAIDIYNQVLRKQDDIEVRLKLADTLSWYKKYTESIRQYDQILAKGEDSRVRLQKARVLGWAKLYGRSIKEYLMLLAKKYSRNIELEMMAKAAYWDGKVYKAIKYYNKLIKRDPDNVEAMFDLSQVYSYQSMWKKALGEYKNILSQMPTHFRAREGFKKAQLISSRVLMGSGYNFIEADSTGRDSDIRKHMFLTKAAWPLRYDLRMSTDYTLTTRMFSDFSDVLENEGRIRLSYINKPAVLAEGFYDVIKYNKDIKSMHTFGGTVYFRPSDIGELGFFYERERLENSSFVIRNHYYSDNFKARMDLDILRRLKMGADYTFSRISDRNKKKEPGADAIFFFGFDPRRLTLKYRYFFKEFNNAVSAYFSPARLTTNSVEVNWRHYLNKEEVFFGADDLYYDIKYTYSADSQKVASNKFSFGINWDINKRLNMNLLGTISKTNHKVYRDSSVMASIKYYF